MIDYLSQNMWQFWAIVSVIFLILEMTSGDFFIVCFAVGAAGAAIVAPFGSIYWQLGAFALVTFLCLTQVRPFALRYLHRGERQRASNADALIGREGKVEDAIPAMGYGSVQVDGDIWKARTTGGLQLESGTRVRIVSRESIVVTVEPVA